MSKYQIGPFSNLDQANKDADLAAPMGMEDRQKTPAVRGLGEVESSTSSEALKHVKELADVAGHELEEGERGRTLFCNLSVCDRTTKELIAVILGYSTCYLKSGRYLTKGATGMLFYDRRVHEFREASDQELEQAFAPGFYESRLDHALLLLARYSDRNGEMVNVTMDNHAKKMTEIEKYLSDLDSEGADDTRFALKP